MNAFYLMDMASLFYFHFVEFVSLEQIFFLLYERGMFLVEKKLDGFGMV